MSHFARVKNGVVQEVIVAEQEWIDWAVSIGYKDGNWYQTSYNTFGGVHYEPNSNPKVASADQSQALRMNFASKGMLYSKEGDAFYDPQPYPSWTLNTKTYQWEPPVAQPDDDNEYSWNEETQSWDVYTRPK